MEFRPGLRGFYAFAIALGVTLAPFQRTIARAAFGPERETVAVMPRGHGKTQLAGLIGLHHLVTVERASISLGAASREQASIAYAVMRDYAEHPALAGTVAARVHELRADSGGLLRVVSGRGERLHGRTDSLAIIDELHVASESLLEAAETGLIKRPDARLLIISTAAASVDSPLGRLRQRALSGDTVRRGAFLDARAPGMRWLEWSVPDGLPLTVANVRKANVAPWISTDALREQRARCTPTAWATFHACRWHAGAASWLPEGAWSACREEYTVEDGETITIGVDIGGARAASAVVAVTDDLRVAAVEIFNGNDSVLEATAAVRRLAGRYVIRECAFDPWRFKGEALRLEQEGIGPMVELPQSHARATQFSERLHAAVVERRLRHPGHPELDRHISHAVARPTGRGWRLDKTERNAQIDAAISLAMAVDRATQPTAAIAFHGFV